MHHNGEPAQRRAALDVRDQIRWDLDAFFRRPEHEIVWVENKLLVLIDDSLGDVLVDLPLAVGVDRGNVGMLKLEEGPSEPEIDTRRLDLEVRIRKRLDGQLPLGKPASDISVREDHMLSTSHRG